MSNEKILDQAGKEIKIGDLVQVIDDIVYIEASLVTKNKIPRDSKFTVIDFSMDRRCILVKFGGQDWAITSNLVKKIQV